MECSQTGWLWCIASCAAFPQRGRRADGTISYVDGANVAGFVNVADAMLAQGVI